MTAKTPPYALDDALVDPKSVFRNPDAVVDADQLEDKDKVAILSRWREDALALQRAGSESMTGGEDDLLQSVERALERVGPVVKVS